MIDDTATENMIHLTASALEELKSLLAKPENAGKNLRVYVEKGGCSGMQYGLTFDEVREGDLISHYAGAKVLLDAFSAKYISGATIDYSDALTGGGFKLTNPNARQSCGCGKSFEA